MNIKFVHLPFMFVHLFGYVERTNTKKLPFVFDDSKHLLFKLVMFFIMIWSTWFKSKTYEYNYIIVITNNFVSYIFGSIYRLISSSLLCILPNCSTRHNPQGLGGVELYFWKGWVRLRFFQTAMIELGCKNVRNRPTQPLYTLTYPIQFLRKMGMNSHF